jgi:16S rRNA (guanine(966)-N(2))-methyltransferase RsmD
MRISGGDARGIRLQVPPGARPASERVRQAVFSSLAAAVPGAVVLDLYCGSGAYGLEALSRGADRAVFVDRDHRAMQAARANARSIGIERCCTFHRRDVDRYMAATAGREGPFDLVFVDPPYDTTVELDHLAPALRPGGRVVLEGRWRRGAGVPACHALMLEADRRYGDTRVLILRRGET